MAVGVPDVWTSSFLREARDLVLLLEWVGGRWQGTCPPAISGSREDLNQFPCTGQSEARTSGSSWETLQPNPIQGEIRRWAFLSVLSALSLGVGTAMRSACSSIWKLLFDLIWWLGLVNAKPHGLSELNDLMAHPSSGSGKSWGVRGVDTSFQGEAGDLVLLLEGESWRSASVSFRFLGESRPALLCRLIKARPFGSGWERMKPNPFQVKTGKG